MIERIGVIGAGAWGTALSMLLADKGHEVTLWMHEKDLAEEMAHTRENRVYLPGFALPVSIAVTSSLESAVKDKTIVLSVVPSHTVRSVVKRFAPFLEKDSIIISASKGIEIDTLMPLSEVFKDVLPNEFHDRLCFLSGPSFAKEVARKMPTAVALASYDPLVGKKAQEVFSNAYFRVYTNPDVIGVELRDRSRTSWPSPLVCLKAWASDTIPWPLSSPAGSLRWRASVLPWEETFKLFPALQAWEIWSLPVRGASQGIAPSASASAGARNLTISYGEQKP